MLMFKVQCSKFNVQLLPPFCRPLRRCHAKLAAEGVAEVRLVGEAAALGHGGERVGGVLQEQSAGFGHTYAEHELSWGDARDG